MDVLDGAHVQTAGGLNCDDQSLVTVQLTGNDGLLLVAARHGARHGNRALTGTHVKLLNQFFRVGAHCSLIDKAKILEPGLIEALEHHVLLQRKVQHKAVLVAILGNVAHIRAALANGRLGAG